MPGMLDRTSIAINDWIEEFKASMEMRRRLKEAGIDYSETPIDPYWAPAVRAEIKRLLEIPLKEHPKGMLPLDRVKDQRR